MVLVTGLDAQPRTVWLMVVMLADGGRVAPGCQVTSTFTSGGQQMSAKGHVGQFGRLCGPRRLSAVLSCAYGTEAAMGRACGGVPVTLLVDTEI